MPAPTRLRATLSAFLIAALSACAGGVAEFQYYGDAFETQYVEGAAVIDRLATAERVVVRRLIAAEEGIPAFDPNQSLYYLEIGDPPLSGAIRASLDAVRSYNGALTGLANGEAAEALTQRMAAATVSISAAAGSVAGATGAGAVFAPSLQAAIAAVSPIFQRLATIANRFAFRDELIAAYPDLRALMTTLRAGTPDMFEVMKRSYVRRGSLGGGGGISAEDLARLEEDRRLLAGWVVLMDQTLVAMDTAVSAARDGGSQTGLAGLTEAAVEIRTLAGLIRALKN